jgi:predicted nucleic acid-binding protein
MPMNNHIIDCCSLLNLYTGWGSLNQLGELNRTWHICEAVLNEVEYTREYGADGKPTLVRLNLSANMLLHPTSINGDEEMATYIDFASELDDGEAQALAIAQHRGFVLLTDDNKAIKIARRPEVDVKIVTTADMLRAWAQQSAHNEAALPTVIRRITTLARFSPKASSLDHAWWNTYLSL